MIDELFTSLHWTVSSFEPRTLDMDFFLSLSLTLTLHQEQQLTRTTGIFAAGQSHSPADLYSNTHTGQ